MLSEATYFVLREYRIYHDLAIPRTRGAVKNKNSLTLNGINAHTKSSKLFLSRPSPQGCLTKVIVVDWVVELGWVSERDESQVR